MYLEHISYEPIKEVTFEELQKWWLNILALSLAVPIELLQDAEGVGRTKTFTEMCKRGLEDETSSL